METLAATLSESLASYGPSLVAALLIVGIGWWVSRLLAALTRRLLVRASVEGTLVAFLVNLVYAAAMVLVVITALGELGVNTTSFAAVVAAAGLAIGFALQGSLANFAAGIMLVAAASSTTLRTRRAGSTWFSASATATTCGAPGPCSRRSWRPTSAS